MQPTFLAGRCITTRPYKIRLVFVCTVDECQEVFVAQYTNKNNDIMIGTCVLSETKLLQPVFEQKFPESVESLSPTFCETFRQALVAEHNGLDEIAGPGYGKALEFLVKDYLTGYKFKDDDEMIAKVRGMFLGRCIADLIDEQRIKDCASRAAWLRNDETHYTRKWADKDIQDLKKLIRMTVGWIELVVESDEYQDSMPRNQ